MKKAFTLIELIIVIGIIGVLMSVMIMSFSGGTDSARAAKCLSNMRNLAQAAIAHATDAKNGVYPCAGSYAEIEVDTAGEYYVERRGWISWLSKSDPYAARTGSKSRARSFQKCANVSPFCENLDDGEFALKNGSLWRYVNRSRSAYVCPLHQRMAESMHKSSPLFSYVMNAYFGYDSSNGSEGIGDMRVWMTNSGVKSERRLLFAELPFGLKATSDANNGLDEKSAFSAAASPLRDATLQYKATYNNKNYNDEWSGKPETIAFNHKYKKTYYAHVVFADGHTEKLAYPTGGGMSLQQLTALLCTAADVGFNGKSYGMQKNGDD